MEWMHILIIILWYCFHTGIELRKVDKKEPGKEEKAGSTLHDVASILARRVAVEMSDSDSGSDSESDGEWGEETSA